MLSSAREGALPDGVSRAWGRCQGPAVNPELYTALSLNENTTIHQLAAGMFYNTFPEDFSVITVFRLSGKFIILLIAFPPYWKMISIYLRTYLGSFRISQGFSKNQMARLALLYFSNEP